MLIESSRTGKEKTIRLACCGLLHFGAVLLVEPLDTTGCIDQFLFAGEEGMTLGADLQTDIRAFRRASFKSLPTSAGNGHLNIFRMDVSFH